MGVYIKDMEMPKEPDEMIELAIYGDGKTLKTGESWRSPVDGKCYYGTSEDMNTYSAFAVPSHGRLIDADALKVQDGWLRDSKYFSQDSGHTHITFVYSNDICNASAIIEAEDGE